MSQEPIQDDLGGRSNRLNQQPSQQPSKGPKFDSKLVLIAAAAVILVVGGILLFKTVYAPGVSNQVTHTPTPTPSTQDISITTDKSSYTLGETVEITVQNNRNAGIGYYDYSGQTSPQFTIEKLQNGVWEKDAEQNKSACACNSDCVTYANGWVLLDPNSTVKDSWSTQEDCTNVVVQQGTYRVVFSYSNDTSGQGSMQTVYSKQFTVGITDTSTWQTYRNDEYGFEVKYPADSILEARSTGEDKTVQFVIRKGEPSVVYAGFLAGDEGDDIVKSQIHPTLASNRIVNESEEIVHGQTWQVVELTELPVEGIGTFGYIKTLYQKDEMGRVYAFYCLYCNEEAFGEFERDTREFLYDIISTFRFVDETACAPVDIAGYSYKILAGSNYYDAGYNGEVKTDLSGDGIQETVRAYIGLSLKSADDIERPKGSPIIVKVFSEADGCFKKVFSYQGTGDFPQTIKEFQNFWGDNTNVVLMLEQDRGFATGTKGSLKFFAYRNGEYQVIEGSQLGGYGLRYKFAGENGIGTKIITATDAWEEGDCGTCAHKQQFFVYTWNGTGYDETKTGITQNKYFSETIDEILQKEPGVLNVQ